MRKILLGTTAVVGAALLAPTMAAAQEAPTVRIGGYFRAYYGYIQQTSANVTGITPAGRVNQALNVGDVGIGASTAANNNGTTSSGAASARLGKHDFSTDAAIRFLVNGKTANGMTYGAVVEIEFDSAESTYRPARRSINTKTTASVDEMYAFIASPTLGQVRFGDEDGPVGGLMNVGFVTNFGTGGVYGVRESFVVRPNRTTTSPGSIGDNTKIIYLSPQFAGFDFGASWAFNEAEGEDTGCTASFSGPYCDRAYAATGATTNGRATFSLPGRLNEHQFALRWRGNVAGVGLGAYVGYMGAQTARELSVTGIQSKTLRDVQVYMVGAQASYMGLTVGGNYMTGTTSYYYIPITRGAKPMQQFDIGASYTFGPVTIGANAFWGSYDGSASQVLNAAGTGLVPGSVAAQGQQRRYSWAVGANYRFAPGLDLIAEWSRHVMHERGVDLDGQGNNGVQDRLRADVFLTGVRLNF